MMIGRLNHVAIAVRDLAAGSGIHFAPRGTRGADDIADAYRLAVAGA